VRTRRLYGLNAGLFAGKLHEQAGANGVSLPGLLNSLYRNMPGIAVGRWFYFDALFSQPFSLSHSSRRSR
jgi:hypothetical protein